MIKLVSVDAIRASEYNPRKNDEKRLALTELSLRKLGFLLPIYADESGEILSGHQRQLVAVRMGFKEVPVEYVSREALQERKSINLLFNRATNDLQKTDTCTEIKNRLYDMGVEGLAANFPDITPGSPESYPCISAVCRMDTARLAKQNHRQFDTHIAQLAKALERRIGTAMPVVITESGKVINGIGRLQFAVESGKRIIQCVKISDAQAALASPLLNLLSMDFDIKSTYADDLRFNSFRRTFTTRRTDAEGNCNLGNGFFIGIWPSKKGRDFITLDGDALETWKKKYGVSVVDFGAGKLSDTAILRKAGIHVAAFEPYFVASGNNVHKGKSVELAERFLDDVESGTKYSTVFISSVFNSVPFIEDRKQIAIIASALCYPAGLTVCWCQSNLGNQFLKKSKTNMCDQKKLTFDLDYEPNITLGDFSRCPKVQKGHTAEELKEIFLPCFGRIRRMEIYGSDKSWYTEIDQPKVNPASLAAALDFEFELPYSDGTRMGLSGRARQVFEHRLGIALPASVERRDNDGL